MILETRNLFVRDTEFTDCEYFARWEKEEDVKKFFTINEERDYEEVVSEYVLRKENPSMLQFTIVYKESNEPIGRFFISRIDRACDSCDITRIYIAYNDMRGKGYGEEALVAVLDYFFINLSMERVTLDYFTGNRPAESLYTKLGFKPEGVARNAGKKDGKYYDLHLMSMLRSEYYENLHTN